MKALPAKTRIPMWSGLAAGLILSLLLATNLAAQPQDDFGDAPDPTYPTLLASGGAQHVIQPGMFLGTLIDGETNGQPHAYALGDDLALSDDEDGVLFFTPTMLGQTVQVTASAAGFLNAWIDFGADGSWAQPGDQIFVAQPLSPGVNVLTFPVPSGAVLGVPTFARFRFSSQAQLGFAGLAPDGEVEDYAVIITEEEAGLDFGDAPDQPYPTLLASGGANHQIVPGMFLGWLIDAERDGQPNATATGDDLAKLPDEDGVMFTTPLVPGQTVQVQVVASTAGFLNAWLDFAADGSWAQLSDQIFGGTPLSAGTNFLAFAVPSGAATGVPTFARFRFSTQQQLGFGGAAPDGEVEDYRVVLQNPQAALDFGDAPDAPYPTWFTNNGARHVIAPGMFLGSLIDSEPDGQPNGAATGDDNANLADEDGVVFITPLIQGQTATVIVTASMAGMLNAWIDFGADGSWAQAGDQIFNNQVLAAGANTLNFGVPINASMGPTYARFRYNTTGNLSYTGSASDGEVEDYHVFIEEPIKPVDFGDAPDPTYPTYLTNNGAFHYLATGVWLGSVVDSETDGQPNGAATGDDLVGLADEDGVIFATPLTPGLAATITVVASTNGNLDAWIDFGADGSWAQAGDQVFTNQPLVTGTNTFNVTVPVAAVAGNTYARFRFSTAGGLTYTGPAPDGEVEDYQVKIQPFQGPLDFGDAPDPTYPTWLTNNGARHIVVPGMFLGTLIDSESDGQPNPGATGDDLALLADEDGVQFVGWLIPGQLATVTVTASVPGLLDAWLDFGADGSWAQPVDQIATSLPLIPGLNVLNFLVPVNATWGQATFARFRFSSAGGLSFTGLAADGEVEDYRVRIEQPPQHDLGDAPDSSNHTGLPMTAYPRGGPAGVLANYPTVFTPISSPPCGPIHMQPKAIAYLGPSVSLEWEADQLVDDDMINNLLPLSDQPDLDRWDDGVTLPLTLPHCAPTTLQYQITLNTSTNVPFFVNIWFDWNRDGDWNDNINCPNGQVASEWAVQNQPINLLLPGPFPAVFTNTTPSFIAWHPPGAKQPIWMRVTFSEQTWPPPGGTIPVGGEGPVSGYSFGETEDYYLEDYDAEESFDWGDAPDPTYPTRAASTGAQHLIIPAFRLGVSEDAETDGQPDAAATGDDTNNVADEDGITFTTPLLLATQACVNVVLQSGSAGGLLDAWVDFNSDGVWGAGDQIFASQPLVPGTNAGLCFAVPATGKLGPTFARFRLSSVGGLTPAGPAPDGEVEDYFVVLKQFRPLTNIVITNIAVTNVMVGTNAGQAITLWWTTQTNLHCQVEAVTNLTGAPTNLNWFNVGGEVIGPSNTQTETNVPAPSERYYRVRAPFTWP
jgi:hypothetical protein